MRTLFVAISLILAALVGGFAVPAAAEHSDDPAATHEDTSNETSETNETAEEEEESEDESDANETAEDESDANETAEDDADESESEDESDANETEEDEGKPRNLTEKQRIHAELKAAREAALASFHANRTAAIQAFLAAHNATKASFLENKTRVLAECQDLKNSTDENSSYQHCVRDGLKPLIEQARAEHREQKDAFKAAMKASVAKAIEKFRGEKADVDKRHGRSSHDATGADASSHGSGKANKPVRG